MNTKINILIAEDHCLVAKLLRNEISSDMNFNVVGLAKNSDEVYGYLVNEQIDLLLLDIVMPKVNGFVLLTDIKEKYINIKVLMISSIDDAVVITQALKLGANGFLTKFADNAEIIEAIYTIMNGELFICRRGFNNFIKTLTGNEVTVNLKNKDLSDIFAKNGNNIENFKSQNFNPEELNIDGQSIINNHNLTQREKEILSLIMEEYTTKEISEKLFISSRTVETHRKNILHKCGVKSSLSLIKMALAS